MCLLTDLPITSINIVISSVYSLSPLQAIEQALELGCIGELILTPYRNEKMDQNTGTLRLTSIVFEGSWVTIFHLHFHLHMLLMQYNDARLTCY